MSDYRMIPPGIWKSHAPDGRTIYVMPGPPGIGTGKYQAMHDIIEDPQSNQERRPGELSLQTADTLHILNENCVRNRKMGEMEDWRQLWGRESGKICLLVSCGPSLTDSVQEIAELAKDKEKYFTLGINRALKAIDLDYFVCLDRRAQLDWVDRDTGSCVLIAATTAANHVAKRFERRYWGETFLANTDEGNAPIRTGLCITLCDAMHAAYKMGAEEIWLYGCDFGMSGVTKPDRQGQDQYQLEKYYFDLPSYVGLGIRPESLRELQPVYQGGALSFINYELWAYACYATVMACMIEESGGVPVKNKTPGGLMTWGQE